jgi:hypothetical protein
VTVERLVELVIRSLTAEHEVADVHRGHSSYTDRVPLVVVDRDGARWRVLVMVEPWRRRHDLGSSRSSPGGRAGPHGACSWSRSPSRSTSSPDVGATHRSEALALDG